MKERKGFFKFLNMTGFVVCWLGEIFSFILKGAIDWQYTVMALVFLYLTWGTWND